MSPVGPKRQFRGGASLRRVLRGLCCKSRKLQGHEFFAKTRNGKRSPIRITSIALGGRGPTGAFDPSLAFSDQFAVLHKSFLGSRRRKLRWSTAH
jgi:hypothetical protein